MRSSDRRTFLKTVLQGTLATGIGLNLPEGAWVYADEAAGIQNNNQTRENRMEADVLVVGGGIAGCFAAIKAAEQGAKVVLADKGYVGKSGQSPYGGGFMIYNADWGHDLNARMKEYNKVSEYLNNRYWTETTLKESYARYQDMMSYGVQFAKNPVHFEKGKDDKSPVSGAKAPAGQQQSGTIDETTTGDYCLILRKQVLKSGAIILDRIMITELLKQYGRIVGAVGLSVDNDEMYAITAKATIMCVGACGFKPAGYPPLAQLTCDGEAMAYRAGAEILGKEFVDTHFTRGDIPNTISRRRSIANIGMVSEDLRDIIGVKEPPTIVGRGPIPERINAEGKKILESDRGEGASRYTYSYLQLEFEAHAGRAPISSNGKETVGGACLGMSHRKADGIWPANDKCVSSVPGLYAAGDALGNMQNGAVYAVGGSSLAGGAVTGTIAGEAAAQEARQMGKLTVNENEIQRAKQFVYAPKELKGGYSPRWVTQLLQNTMMPYFISYIKKEDRLQATLTIVEFINQHLVPKLFARDAHELRLAHETRNMVLSAEMRLRSALFRTESRGNHYREDYPRRDDSNWLAWTKIKEEKGKMKLIKVPIPKEWWPDQSIPYQQRYPFRFPGEEA
ncbi:MAG: FAD-binding protein [Deltaproteobacteria bacterium]|nr:FAD-binding protein [Deltaproteobacteria bacterium]